LKCPFCGTDEDRVIDSRAARDGKAIRRRRECSSCGNRFTTYEVPEEQVVFVLKTNGVREPFDRSKVYRGISIACNKRPISTRQLEEITATIENKVLTAADSREISTVNIGQWILDELSGIDEVAYIRFASVFKRYENVDEFLRELKEMRPKIDAEG
jgi:transcriptional repressor NrdR